MRMTTAKRSPLPFARGLFCFFFGKLSFLLLQALVLPLTGDVPKFGRIRSATASTISGPAL